MRLLLIIILTFLDTLLFCQIKVEDNFENANVEVMEIIDSTNTIVISPSLKNDLNTTRCWFYFKISGYDKSQLLNVRINFTSYFTAPNYPVYSYDQTNWIRIATTYASGSKNFSAYFTADTVYIAMGYPYTYTHLKKYLETIKNNNFTQVSILTKSEQNNEIYKVRITDSSKTIRKQIVWIIARQHAFESHASYMMEGMLDFFVSEDDAADKLRQITEIHIVPMVDVDNVILGASGRMQLPIDLNRDWNDSSYWKAVKEMKKQIYESVINNNYSMFWDLHSAYPGSYINIYSYIDIYMNRQESLKIDSFWNEYQTIANIRPFLFSGKETQEGIKWADQYNGNRDCNNIPNCFKTNDFAITLESEWNLRPDNEPWNDYNLKKEGYNVAKTIAKYIVNKYY